MQQLHGPGDRQPMLCSCAKQPGRQQREPRTEAFAAGLDEFQADVAEQSRVTAQFRFEVLIEALEVSSYQSLHSGDYTGCCRPDALSTGRPRRW